MFRTYIEKGRAKPQVQLIEEGKRIDNSELCEAGYYTCSKNGLVTHITDREGDYNIRVWIYSVEENYFKFSRDTLMYPIVIRKGNHVWYASFRNFNDVYNDVCRGGKRFRFVEMTKTLFDPEMFSYTIRVALHNTTGTEPLTHPWMFFRDKMESSKIEEPREGARKALNVSYAFYVGNKIDPVYFYLYFMGGNYYCQRITEVDPMLSKELFIRGYELSGFSDDKMTIRYKVYNGELIVIGGYHDPKRYKRLTYYYAEREIYDKDARKKFLKEMSNHNLRTYTLRRKYDDISNESLLLAKKDLEDSYKRDILNKIQVFKEKNLK